MKILGMKFSLKIIFVAVTLGLGLNSNAQNIEDLPLELLRGVMQPVEEAEEHYESAEHAEEKAGIDPVHHVLDAHDVHLWGAGESSFSIPLPIILWTENGLVTFMSSKFHHDDSGHHIVEANGMNFVKSHGKIYQLNEGEHAVAFDAEHHVANAVKPVDLSITKNVFAIFCVAIIMFLIFRSVGKQYKVGEAAGAPRGLAGFMEPLVVFVRDFSKENIGEGKYLKFMPYLLTVFFFILFGNLFGLIPFLGGINMTGSISITLLLALFTLIIQMVNSKGPYWKHILMPPGVPVALWPILVPIELIGVLVKPAALMIRLFANITAGHIIILSLIGIIFINQNMAWAGLSVPMALFISVLELLVAFLQAYIFTMLSAMFIGSAVEEAHH
ncbi:F0F1 ATP synthase subunit A [Crocinitomix catalasitica]|uniref:F0F1 ATP synthase subunit A n=1 Tax=Crocinitomix catalasitica TaxID=184607 RepID=UPI000481CAC9|nr:F0F1 ATP synthase subunit A [Crocinitomix catalasitica]